MLVPGENNTTTVDAIINKFKSKYPALEAKKNSFKTVTPIMNMLTAFKLSMDESSEGTSEAMYDDITTFGLNRSHLAQCRGITFPPERRTGLLKCLGVGALSIALIREKTYKEKIVNALKEITATVPYSASYVDCLVFRYAKS